MDSNVVSRRLRWLLLSSLAAALAGSPACSGGGSGPSAEDTTAPRDAADGGADGADADRADVAAPLPDGVVPPVADPAAAARAFRLYYRERVERVVFGGIELLEAIPLCLTTPGVLDCTWARMGCARPDLDHDGTVGETDRQRFQQAAAAATTGCAAGNGWCDGADLDHTGAVDALDAAFLDAAQGCHYEVAE